MATDLHPVKQPVTPKKHEAFVETQLARARARIRCLDLAGAALGLVILTLAYGLTAAVIDRSLELSPLARQTAFAVYAAGALVYVGVLVLRPLFRQINPYYAARRLEQTIPEAKNSIVNWLDLHGQAIAPAFRSAISQQAARDLADADLDQAISARRASWLGAGAAALFLCLLVLFVLGPRQFLSLMHRAFAPFVESPIATRTRLELVRPEGGDVTVPVGRAVRFSVWVEGRIPEASSPEALRLLYRYHPSDPYQSRLLERGESSWEWSTSLLASEIHNGLWYKIAGGDAETPEYRIQVRSTPLLTGFDVTYHYRPYLGWPDRITHDQNLQDLRGTEVTLLARTNRTVKEGQLAIEGQKPSPGELVPEDPQALRFRLRLEHDAHYRIWFRSVDGERNTDPMAYPIRVLQDRPPQLEVTKPGQDTQLPVNGVLNLEGSASDDFGLVRLDLRMKIENGPALQPKPYRKGEALRRGDGSYPQMLAYRDFLELDKLAREDGRPVEALRPGTTIEYWLEGTDNCDYPGPNVGESKHFKVTIRPADTDHKKQEQQREQARTEQQKHEQKQDRDLQNQRRETPDRSHQQHSPPNGAEQPNKESAPPNEDELNKQKEKIENAIKNNEQQQSGKKGESEPNQSQDSKGEATGQGQQQERSQGKGQGKANEGSEGKPQADQDKGNGKADANREKGSGKGEGHATLESRGDGDNQGGQRNAEHRSEQEKTGENKERSEAAPKRNDQSGQAGKKTDSRSQENRGGQAQDRTSSAAERKDATSKSNQAAGTPGANTETKKDQSSGQDQRQGPKQNEKTTGQNERGAAEANPGQSAAHERPGSQKEQKPGGEQKRGAAAGDQKPSSSLEKGNEGNTDKKPEAGAERNAKQQPGREGRKQDSSQSMREGQKGDPSEKTQKEKQDQQRGNPQGSQEQPGNNSASPNKSGEKGAGPARGAKAGESQGEANTPDQAVPQQGSKEGGQSGKEKTDAAHKPNGTADKSGTETEEKSAGTDKGDGNSQDPAKPENHGASQKPSTGRGQKAEETGKDRSASGKDESGRAQQSKPNSQGAKDGGEKSKDEVSALSEALKGRDEKGRAEARKKLEQLRDNAKDPAVRQAAADALDRAGQDSTERSAQKSNETKAGDKGRTEEQAPGKNGQNSPVRENKQAGSQKPGEQKRTEDGTGPRDASNDQRRNPDHPNTPSDSRPESGDRRSPSPADASKKPGRNEASGNRSGNDPTAQPPDPKDSLDNRPTQEQAPMEPPTPPNAAYQKQAGEMQLEDIKKKINKDVLKQLNMTEEEFQKFVKAYQQMLERRQPPGTDKENLTSPQRGNRALPNQKVRMVDPREQTKDGSLQRLGPALAPPEFRKAYQEFSRQISELEQTKEKK